MTEQLVIKARTSTFNLQVMDEIRVTTKTTCDEMAATFRRWRALGWEPDWTVEKVPDDAEGEISNVRRVVIPFPIDLAYSRRT
jgi:hypothetical protein